MPVTVTLTPHLEEMVHQKVQSGRYTSVSEVIREALRLMQDHDALRQANIDQLRQDIYAGIESGAAVVWDAEAVKKIARDRTNAATV
jgi:antitoxin ParD1/3/4